MFNWTTFLAYASTTSITPGPNNIMSMSGASQRGVKRNLPFNLGVLVGFIIVGTMSTVLMSVLNTFLPVIKLPMMILGALYLLYLAYKTFTGDVNVEEKKDAHGGFFTAVALQFINPKLYLCCIMSMELYILPHFGGQPLILFGFVVLMAAMAFVSTVLWACFGSAFRRLLREHGRVVNTIMALLLVYCAVSLFLD